MYLVGMRRSNKENGTRARDLPGATGMDLAEEEVGQDTESPKQDVIFPWNHRIQLFRRLRLGGALLGRRDGRAASFRGHAGRCVDSRTKMGEGRLGDTREDRGFWVPWLGSRTRFECLVV